MFICSGKFGRPAWEGHTVRRTSEYYITRFWRIQCDKEESTSK